MAPPQFTGGRFLDRAIDLLVECRRLDPSGPYWHSGNIQWWFGDTHLDDPQNRRIWEDSQRRAIAIAILDPDPASGQLDYQIHPQVRDTGLETEIRALALRRLRAHARLNPGSNAYVMQELVRDDELHRLRYLDSHGYSRGSWYHLMHTRTLSERIDAPEIPRGYTIRSLQGEEEAERRALTHRDCFYPYTSMTTKKYLRVMRTPGYDPQLDLMVVGPGTMFAGGCLCWYDDVNKVGLFEPVGIRPTHRRRGLAKALLCEGLRQLQARGALAALVEGIQPGRSQAVLPAEFTIARWVFRSVGFQVSHAMLRYSRRLGEI